MFDPLCIFYILNMSDQKKVHVKLFEMKGNNEEKSKKVDELKFSYKQIKKQSVDKVKTDKLFLWRKCLRYDNSTLKNDFKIISKSDFKHLHFSTWFNFYSSEQVWSKEILFRVYSVGDQPIDCPGHDVKLFWWTTR